MKAVLAVFGFFFLIPSLIYAGEAATYSEIKIFNHSKDASITAVGYSCTNGVGLSQYDKGNDGIPITIAAPNDKTKCQGLNLQIKYPAGTEIPVKNYYSENVFCQINSAQYDSNGFYLYAAVNKPLIMELNDDHWCNVISN